MANHGMRSPVVVVRFRVPLIPGRSLFGGRKSGVHIQFRWGLFKTVVNYHTRLFILLGDKTLQAIVQSIRFQIE